MRTLLIGLVLAAGCQPAPSEPALTPTPDLEAAAAAWDSLGAETAALDWTLTPNGAGPLEVGDSTHAAAGRRVLEAGAPTWVTASTSTRTARPWGSR